MINANANDSHVDLHLNTESLYVLDLKQYLFFRMHLQGGYSQMFQCFSQNRHCIWAAVRQAPGFRAGVRFCLYRIHG